MSSAKKASSFTTSMSTSMSATPTTTQSSGMRAGLRGCGAEGQQNGFGMPRRPGPFRCPAAPLPRISALQAANLPALSGFARVLYLRLLAHDRNRTDVIRRTHVIARRAGVSLAIAGSVLTLAASAPHVFSPGYTYRLRIDGHSTAADGKTKDYVVLSGRAMVTEKGGRLDIEEASKERGAMTEKGGYLLYDPASMMIVSPKDRKILKFSFEDLEKGMASLANVPGMRVTISDVVVSFEKLGSGGPMLGMSTTKYRLTQDYEIAVTGLVNRNSTEHVVQDLWIADEKKGFANPFARMGQAQVGAGSAFGELMTRTAEAEREMGRGVPLKTVTSTMSMLSRDEMTHSVSTMEVTELQAGNIDDALLTAPTDYQITDMSAQMRAMAAQLEQAKAAQNAEAAQAAEPAKADSATTAKAVAKGGPKVCSEGCSEGRCERSAGRRRRRRRRSRGS